MKKSLNVGTLFLGMLVALAVSAWAAPSDGDIPPSLEPWRDWVLHGREEALCPPQFNDGALTRCQWPTRLKLDLAHEGGLFEQRWLVLSPGWAVLPGNRDVWPDAVSIDGQSVAVIERNGRPAVQLQPGDHRVNGRFFWRQLPETMEVPPALGLLSLTIDELAVPRPVLDGRGKLWLQKSAAAGDTREQLGVKVFRRLQDTIPMQVRTLVRLDVSGKGREVVLQDILLPTSVPMELDSRLPVRLDPAGHLLVQARPGRWEVLVTARLPGPVQQLAPNPAPHGDEIWSFEPRNELRMVEIEGVAPVEPSQTEMPADWRHLAAYQVKAATPMVFKEVRRGDAQPAPDRLSLQRTWWLDFDGRGLTVHDVIRGTLSRQWSLAMRPPMVLGRVAVDGRDRVLTQQGSENLAGVELRRGHLQLEADARLPRRSGPIPALGWKHDFQQVSGVMHLPPGWKLLAAAGADDVSDSWLQRWSLLDFFIVLIIALAVFRLRSWRWALVALVAMVLIYHEPGAPRLVWLHILAVLALLPLLPTGWFRRLLILWGIGAAVVLLTTAVPFMVSQVRWGMYPQLTPVPRGLAPPTAGYDLQESPLKIGKRKAAVPGLAPQATAPEPPAESIQPPALEKTLGWQHDPDAIIPTGPGLPDWQWRTIHLTWNGPVSEQQTLRLILLSPWMNLLLALLRVGFLAALIWGLMELRAWWQKLRRQMHWSILVLGAILAAGGTPGSARADDASSGFPPPALLETLRERLLEKPDCLPQCADISRMEVSAGGDKLQVMLKVHAALKIAVPLPVNRKSWQPEQVLMDNALISGLARDANGQLWALVPKGTHTLVLLGTAGQDDLVRLPLPLRPHMVSVNVDGWTVRGVQADGTVGPSIELARLQGKSSRNSGVQRGTELPPFLHVERVLHLGLTWQMTTTVRRLTPPGTPVVVGFPLLADESVTTDGFQVDQGELLMNLSADQRTATFGSTLTIAPLIRLTAPRAVPWTETWILDAGAMWHCDLEGIPVIHHQDKAGQWRPRWRPWPGEQVNIRVRRPKAVAGQLLTVDAANLVLTPGQRFGKGDLSVRLRTSRGGQHTLELPPKANLQRVRVDGRSLPIRQDGPFVTVPVQPGARTVDLAWLQPAPFSALFNTPKLKVGHQAVNARISIKMPANRWILMAGGPRWGPAVLFWSYLLIIVLAAVALGRVPLTPLKTWQWLLLGLGLTQIPAATAMIIVGWLLVLGLRERQSMPDHWLPFNAIQAGLVIWTLAALVCMFFAVEAGLLGQPEMQIAGNQSHARLLNWTQDHIGESMPQAWVFSLPVWVFSVLMLAWSLWLALSLLGWLKWGWRCFSKEGMWRKAKLLRRKKPAVPAETSSGPDRS